MSIEAFDDLVCVDECDGKVVPLESRGPFALAFDSRSALCAPSLASRSLVLAVVGILLLRVLLAFDRRLDDLGEVLRDVPLQLVARASAHFDREIGGGWLRALGLGLKEADENADDLVGKRRELFDERKEHIRERDFDVLGRARADRFETLREDLFHQLLRSRFQVAHEDDRFDGRERIDDVVVL